MTFVNMDLELDGCFGFEVKDKVTAEDYDRFLVPIFNGFQSQGEKARVLFSFSSDFKGFTASALLKDFIFGIKYLNTFDRCAIVTDLAWLAKITVFFSRILPFKAKVFSSQDFTQAKQWLSAN